MTAIVLDIQNNNSIVLGEDGKVYMIKSGAGDAVGQAIEFPVEQENAVNRKRRFLHISTHFVTLFILVFLGLLLLFLPSALQNEDFGPADLETTKALQLPAGSDGEGYGMWLRYDRSV